MFSEWLRDLWRKISADLSRAHKSFTIWFNGLMAIAVTALPMAQDNLPQLQDYFPANFYHYLMGALIVGNIALRFKTNGALAEK